MKPTNIPIFRQRDPTQSAWLIILFVFILTINKVGFTASQVACGCAGAVTKRLCIWAGAVVQKPPIKTEKNLALPSNHLTDGHSGLLSSVHATKSRSRMSALLLKIISFDYYCTKLLLAQTSEEKMMGGKN